MQNIFVTALLSVSLLLSRPAPGLTPVIHRKEIIAGEVLDLNCKHPSGSINQGFSKIKFYPNVGGTSERQNLYIRNNKDYPVEFKFTQEGNLLKFVILKAN